MLKHILISVVLAAFSEVAFAETGSSPPFIGGEDLPVEVVSQLIANGPLIAVPVANAVEVAKLLDSGLKPCLRRGVDGCTATVDKAKKD
jgi:hypothetical protein